MTMKTTQLLICLFLLTGCAPAIVKMQFSSSKEVFAYKQAEWIVYATNQEGAAVMFDPYQVKYSNPNNFTVPISLPVGGKDNYGNWIWQFRCGSLNARIVSTLGGTPQNASSDYSNNSIAGLIRSKLCGVSLQGDNYKFLSVGGQNMEVYYAQTGLQQHSLRTDTYKVNLAFKKPSDNFTFSKIEVDCRRSQFRFEGGVEWKGFTRRSPLDILRLRVCNSPELKPYQLVKYSDEVKAGNSANTPVVKSQLRTSGDLDQPTKQITDTPSQKCRRIGLKPGGEDFDLCVRTMTQ
jgi:hypothetical protein